MTSASRMCLSGARVALIAPRRSPVRVRLAPIDSAYACFTRRSALIRDGLEHRARLGWSGARLPWVGRCPVQEPAVEPAQPVEPPFITCKGVRKFV